MEDELRHLRLKGNDIAAYTNRFNELVLLCPDVVPTTKKKIGQYIKRGITQFCIEKMNIPITAFRMRYGHYEFQSVQFLGHVINSEGVHVDPAKSEAIKNWPAPTLPTEVKQFMGLAVYYRRFIEGFSLIAKPLTKLTQKNKKFEWCADEDEAFQKLKQDLCTAPILAFPKGPEISFLLYASLKVMCADALSRKVRDKPLRVRSLVISTCTDLSERILKAQLDVVKQENVKAENLGRLLKPIFEIYSNGIRSRQKSYADVRRKPMEFDVGHMVMLKVSPWKGVIQIGKQGKLSPRYVGPFKIFERIGPVAYRLELPEKLCGIHNMFYVSNLKKCLADENLVIPLKEIQLDEKLHFIEKPVEIMDREVKRINQRRNPIVKVCWNSRRGLEFAWEREDFFLRKYPHLFPSKKRGHGDNRAPGRCSRKDRRM
ncbi:hypothetical protein Tco_1309896 [Tanacetum coccineum]